MMRLKRGKDADEGRPRSYASDGFHMAVSMIDQMLVPLPQV
jgi:hypothetical protein